jgi:hypothetical protein
MSNWETAHLATKMFNAILRRPCWLFWLFLKTGNWSRGFRFLWFAMYMKITRSYVRIRPRIADLGDGERWRIWQSGLDKS